jgi:succinyl-diaminopimelate desuccinylase
VVEFGIVGETMHKVDERCTVADVHALARIYERLLDRFFDA